MSICIGFGGGVAPTQSITIPLICQNNYRNNIVFGEPTT